MGYPLATEFPRTRAPRQTPNPRSCLCCRGARVRRARPRARNVGLPAPRKVRSRVPPPCRIRTCPPPNRRCYDATAAIFLSRSCPREACNGAHLPRARELKRRPLGAAKVPPGTFPELSRRREAVVSALAQKGWVAQAHVSACASFVRNPSSNTHVGRG